MIYPASQWYQTAKDVFLRDQYDPLLDDTGILLVDGGYWFHADDTMEDIEEHELQVPGYKRQQINLCQRADYARRQIRYVALDTKFVLHELPVEGYATENDRAVSGAVVYMRRTDLPISYLSFQGHRYIVQESLTIAWDRGTVMVVEF